MSSISLFPDYSVLETGRNEAQAMRLAAQLREVDLQMLVTDADRRMVVARLRREGIDNAMQLILLTEEEVLRWHNVGPVFVTILSQMRREVVRRPERIVDTWHHQHRLYVLPDDLDLHTEEDDFFGVVMAAEDEAIPAMQNERSLLTEEKRGSAACAVSETSAAALASSILELERCLVAAIEMMEHRAESGVVLRKYYIEGLPVETIVAGLHLASSASLFRIVNKHFRTPLLCGYQVKGIMLSESLLKSIKTLRKSLEYSSSSVLNVLQRIPPMRFLEFLDLTLLQRTQAENFWGGDYIVREGEVERCRRTQRDLFSSLQLRVVGAKEPTIRKGMRTAKNVDRGRSANWIETRFLRVLLNTHPCIELDRKGYRLVSERLNYDCARIARIVYDARCPLKVNDIMAQYERRYMQRPEHLSIAHVRKNFPHVHSIRRGVWEWK